MTGFVLDPPYGRNSQGSLAPIALLGKRALERAKASPVSAQGLVLILPIHPLGERPDEALSHDEEVDLLHGEWPEVLEHALSNAEWSVQGRWVEHVHASLSRLILHATVAPRD